MRLRWYPPHAAQQLGDYYILLGVPQLTKRCAWLTTLEKHCTGLIVRLEKSHRWIAIPKAKSVDFVRAFHMRHTELQYTDVPSVNAAGATQAQLSSAPSKGGPSLSAHRLSRSRTSQGKQSNQAARSGDLRQCIVRRSGIWIATHSFWRLSAHSRWDCEHVEWCYRYHRRITRRSARFR